MTTEEMYYTLLEQVGVNEEVIDVLVAINGDNEETYLDLLYYYMGLRSFDQLED